ncbi:alpha/beta hydrolase [Brevibacillus ginsengisoli]|uniref:alpha/beta hydrolase n=1 Tax=Brevibacillus ginsengisoli TaxID=363854 RepID=UPI003CEF8F7A
MSQKTVKKTVQTNRLVTSFFEAGDRNNPPVLLVHGNVSSNLFWDEALEQLSDGYWVIAPDLRGYGESEAKPIDATRGVRDWSDDLHALVTCLQIDVPIHIIGWSLGGGVVMQYAIDYPESVASLILLNPVSPYGYGGTKDEVGTPCYDNFAGSGAGATNPEFVERLRQGDRSDEAPSSPRNIMNQFYFKPPFRVSQEREEQFVQSMVAIKVGEGLYPGSFETCSEWPGVKPGDVGINNAISPKHFKTDSIADISPKPPILWVRGSDDAIVSDQPQLDFGYLGQQGIIPGWPGEEAYPPQPMVSQTRHVLNRYQANGGQYEEFVVEGAGHSPHIEKPTVVYDKIIQFIQGATKKPH